MRVLVAVGCHAQSTFEVADEIGDVLRRNLKETHDNVEVDVRRAEDVDSVEGYDAAVIGSAVRRGRWLEPARRLVETHAERLSRCPVWLFSASAGGDALRPDAEPAEMALLLAATQARTHRVLGGALPFAQPATGRRRQPQPGAGHFRHWAEVEAWATVVSYELRGLMGARR